MPKRALRNAGIPDEREELLFCGQIATIATSCVTHLCFQEFYSALRKKSLPDHTFAWPSITFSATQPREAVLISLRTRLIETAKKLLLEKLFQIRMTWFYESANYINSDRQK
jgi:hypothetical protein